MPSSTAVIVTGGSPPSPRAIASVPRVSFVIAADSGFDHAIGAGLRVDLIVGDLDSISPNGLAAARQLGIEMERHSPDKDFTDTELALEAAAKRGFRHVTVLSGDSVERFDHLLATVAVVAMHPATLWCGATRIHIAHGPATVSVGRTGPPTGGTSTGTVTLLPWSGDVAGVSTTGLRWPLVDEVLRLGSSRGVSNEVLDPNAGATVTVGTGVLLIIEPESPE